MSIATILPSLDSKISKQNWQFRLANDNTTGAPAGWPRPCWWSPTVLRPSQYPRDCFCL